MSSMLNALKLLEEQKSQQQATSVAPVADVESHESQSTGRFDAPEEMVAAATSPVDDRIVNEMGQIDQLNAVIDCELSDEAAPSTHESAETAEEERLDDTANDQPLPDESRDNLQPFGDDQTLGLDDGETHPSQPRTEAGIAGDSFHVGSSDRDDHEGMSDQLPEFDIGLTHAKDVYASPMHDGEISVCGGIDPELFDVKKDRTNLEAPLPSMLGHNNGLKSEFVPSDPAAVGPKESDDLPSEAPRNIEGQSIADQTTAESVSNADRVTEVGGAFASSNSELEAGVGGGDSDRYEAVTSVDGLEAVTSSEAAESQVRQTMAINFDDLRQSLAEAEPEHDAASPTSVLESSDDASNESGGSDPLPGSRVPTLRLNVNESGGVAAQWPDGSSGGGDAFAAFSAQMARIEPDGSVSRPEPPTRESQTASDTNEDQGDTPFPTSFATVFKTRKPGFESSNHVAAPPASSDPRPMDLPFDFFSGGTLGSTPENPLAGDQAVASIHRLAPPGLVDDVNSVVGQAQPASDQLPSDDFAATMDEEAIQSQAPPAAESSHPIAESFLAHIKQEPPAKTDEENPAESARASFQPDRNKFLSSIRRHMKGRRLLTEYHTVWNAIRDNSKGGITNGSLMFLDCETDRPAAQTLIYTAATPRENDMRSVLLVDADMEAGRLSSMLRLESAPGVSDVSMGADLEGLVHAIDLPNTHVLPAGMNRAAVAPDSMEAMMRELTELYDFVLVAGGLSSNPLVPVVNRACGNSFLVVRLGTSDRSAAIDTVNSLRKVGVNLGGCVVANIEADHTNF